MNLLARSEQAPVDTQLGVVAEKTKTVEDGSVLVLLSVNPSFEIYADDK